MGSFDFLVSRTRVTSKNIVCDYKFLIVKQEIDASVQKNAGTREHDIIEHR